MLMLGCIKNNNQSESEKEDNISDTLYFNLHSPEDEVPSYFQHLKVVSKTDSTIWFEIFYDHAMANETISGVAIDTTSKYGLETDEYEGFTYLMQEFKYSSNGLFYQIRIDIDTKNIARIVTSSEDPTDAVPFDIVMLQKK